MNGLEYENHSVNVYYEKSIIHWFYKKKCIHIISNHVMQVTYWHQVL